MVRVAVLGASGYGARELLKLLARHPHAEVTTLTTRQETRPHVADEHPWLRGLYDLHLENVPLDEVARRADCVFCCLPHAASAEAVAPLLDAGCKVVDFSADYRLTDAAVYQQWYQHEHPDPDRLGKAAYGLPELYRDRIIGANLVANPGCYPTSALLALAPLLKTGLASPEGIIVDSKSGVSGGGRSPKPVFHFPECNESVLAYGVGSHRHTPEIDQVLSDFAGAPTDVVFTPHLVPMDRGIFTTAYATPAQDGVTTANALATLREFYAGERFIRVLDEIPATKNVVGGNCCDLTVRVVRGRLVVLSVIDNLIKGASGAAVQNFNLIYGFEETTAL